MNLTSQDDDLDPCTTWLSALNLTLFIEQLLNFQLLIYWTSCNLNAFFIRLWQIFQIYEYRVATTNLIVFFSNLIRINSNARELKS